MIVLVSYLLQLSLAAWNRLFAEMSEDKICVEVYVNIWADKQTRNQMVVYQLVAVMVVHFVKVTFFSGTYYSVFW
jgi:hypothetical protein